jgi:3-dehydroquinate dehydratase-2
MATILVLNGPNLNLLGQREPHIYGSDSLDDINRRLSAQCSKLGFGFEHVQSNSEADLIDRLQLARTDGPSFIKPLQARVFSTSLLFL